jgi:outer membrane protein assembly factor BamD
VEIGGFELKAIDWMSVIPVKMSFLARALGLVLLSAPLAACDTISGFDPFSFFNKKDDFVPDTPAEVLFNDGLARMQNQNYSAAVKKFAELDKQYPYSQWSRRSILLTTYANYENSEWADAINAGKRYVQLYPATPEAPYAEYMVGMSYFNQMPDIQRDQDRTQKALTAFEDLVKRWPESEYANDSRQRIQVLRDQLAGKEMDIGREYLVKRNYTGAINRFRNVLIKYQTTRHSEEALARLAECYMALGVTGEAQTAAAVLGHNFPDSQWYKDTYKLLQSGGLEPRESSESWISKSFQGLGSVSKTVIGIGL